MTLTDFLLARIAEDEATDMGLPHRDDCRQSGGWPDDPDSAVDCDCGVSARALAECEAKRQITDASWWRLGGPNWRDAIDHTMGALAAVYADHPDYREEWAL